MARLAPFSLAMSSARSTAPRWPEITTWPGSLSLATVQISPCAAASATCLRHLEAGAEQGRHRALADRHGRLHRLAAQLEQPRRGRQVERAGGAERAIFAELWPATKSALSARSIPDAAQGRDRIGHDRRLGVLGQGELVRRPLRHQPRQLLLRAPRRPPRTRRARRALASASSLPMPTAWLPCPGKMNARIGFLLSRGLVGQRRPEVQDGVDFRPLLRHVPVSRGGGHALPCPGLDRI